MPTLPEHGLALLTVAEMARADALAIAAGVPGRVLIERAGRAVADAVSRRVRTGSRVLVLCGPGNNGGDGFVAARLLRERGCRVVVALEGDPARLRGDAAAAAALWPEPVLPIAQCEPAAAELIVDALFGAGLSRVPEGAVAGLIETVNRGGRPVVAVDVPSGVMGDSGSVPGAAIRAAETVTFFRLKPGHLLLPGKTLCGVVTLSDIGITPEVAFGPGGLRPSAFRDAPDLWRHCWPRHGPDTHKFSRGAALVVAGGLSGVGAPRLAARAALRLGAGLVTLACDPDALAAHAARGPDALIQRPLAAPGTLAAMLAEPRLRAVLAGPALGLDPAARAKVMAVLEACVPAVLDADATTLLAPHCDLLRRRVERRRAALVLTPHEGEFSRLFSGLAGFSDSDSKLERARRAAAFSGAVIVLKGADSVIAAPDGGAAINATGSAALATAGSGDVLGGLIAGLLAQGMPAFAAACAAVWLHGRAGERLGAGLIADDLPEEVARVAREELA